MNELESYKLEQLVEKVAELDKMGHFIPFGIIAFVGVLAVGCILIVNFTILKHDER